MTRIEPNSAPISILLVDDEPKNLAVLEALLSGNGYELVRADSPEKALLALVSGEFALLILDVRMPGMDGFELARMIKERKKTANLPIIFLTAYDSEDSRALEGYGTGAVDYLTKPVNPAVLRSKVAVFAELYRKSRETAEANRALLAEVAERRRAEEKMRETVHDLESFSYSIAHDLRAPLRAMAGYANIVLGDHAQQLDPAAKDYLGRIVSASQRMDALIVDILSYSRVLREELPMTAVDVQRLISDLTATYPRLQPEHATIDVDGKLPLVLANEAALTQVLSNLLDNAVKFVAKGVRPKVKVRSEPEAPFVRLWFEDNGIGVPEDARGRLFDIFSRAHASTDYEGTGIGLAIVRKAVERMGGTVGVEFEPGPGCRFWVKLKAAA